jgi:MoaA/NifB/PqqE/SkfB family radical SAM enzyme
MRKDYDETLILNTIKKLIDFNYKIDTILVVGGEPLLYGSLPSLVNELCSIKNIDNITVVTNGTHTINAELLNAFITNRSKIIVRISNYEEKSRKADEIEVLLAGNNIKFEDTKSGKWSKNPHPVKLALPDHELVKKYKECVCNTRDTGKIYVLGDRYYPCAWCMAVENMGFHLPETDFVCLDDSNFVAEIQKLFHSDTFFEACRYCHKGSKSERIAVPVAEQLP